MKKAISILLVITMLLSMAVVPVFAEEASNVGGSVEDITIASGAEATGSNIIPGALTDQYTSEGDWIAVGSWEELVAALSAGVKIYLTADIDAGEANVGTDNGAKLDGAIIDGNGYTITAKGPLFQHTKNTTFQNLILNSDFHAAAGGSALACWATEGYTKLYNLTATVNVIFDSNTAEDQQFSALVLYAQAGSEFENVAVEASLDMTGASIQLANSVGILASRAETATVKNCSVKGSVKVGGAAFDNCNKNYNGVGGLVGQASNVTFEDCTNEAEIEITAPVNSKNRSIGGIAGFVTGVCSFTNCLNKGNVTVNYTKEITVDLTDNGIDEEGNPTNTENDAGMTDVVNVGGVIGFQASAVTFTAVENQGDVNVNVTVSGNMTAAEDNETAVGCNVTSYVAGVIGYASTAPTLNGVLNRGAVSATNNIAEIAITGAKLSATRKAYAAGVLAFAEQQASFPATADMIADYAAKNTGAISSNYYAGGIMAYMTWGAGIQDCVNEGAVTATDIAAGIIANRADGGRYNNMYRCSNSGTITLTGEASVNSDGYVAGLVGCGGYKIENSVNSGTVVADNDATNHTGVYAAGIIAYNQSNPKDADGNILPVAITNCTNNGDIICNGAAAGGIIALAKDNGINVVNCVNNGKIAFTNNTGSWASAGGILGYGNNSGAGNPDAHEKITVSNCVNNGEIVSGESSTGNAEYLAGIVGRFGNPISYELVGCINNGNITAATDEVSYAGGIVGITQAWNCTKSDYIAVIDGCVNAGEITAVRAGGYVGRVNVGGDKGTVYITLDIKNCINAGDVNAAQNDNGYAGGFIGLSDGAAANKVLKYRITDSINYGEINGGKYLGGFVSALPAECSVGIIRCVSVGKMSTAVGKAAIYGISPAPAAITDCAFPYFVGAIGGYDIADVIEIGELSEILPAFYTAQLEAAIEKAEEKAEENHFSIYVPETWADFLNALDNAKATLEAATEFLADKTGDKVTQKAVSDAYKALLKAKEELVKQGEEQAALDKAIADAEAAIKSDKLYTEYSKNTLTAIIEYAKSLKATVDNFASEIQPVIEALAEAADGLTVGGNIYTAEDFAKIDGTDGSYCLMADITINKALESFSGRLDGQGHTITLDGCGLSAILSGAHITDLTVEGNAGGAGSVFGKAEELLQVDNVIVKAENIINAAIFDSADASAEILLGYIVSYADTEVAGIIGNLNCQVTIYFCLSAGNAPAAMGTVKDTSVNAYVYQQGVEYYDGYGIKSKDLTSGKTAYEMNEWFAQAMNDEIAEITLVQVLGKDEYPVIGEITLDATNQVIMKDGKYENKGHVYTEEGDEAVTPILPKEPVYTALNATIARAEALDEALYTEETWGALLECVANAKAARQLTDQERIDAAKGALDVAIARLVKKTDAFEKTDKVDTTELDELLNTIRKLNKSEYTEDSWNALKTVVEAARSTKEATDQATVDAAVEALNNAMARLVKISAGKTESNGEVDKTTEPSDKDGGCASLMGGMAVILTSVIALAGVSLKKKED